MKKLLSEDIYVFEPEGMELAEEPYKKNKKRKWII